MTEQGPSPGCASARRYAASYYSCARSPERLVTEAATGLLNICDSRIASVNRT